MRICLQSCYKGTSGEDFLNWLMHISPWSLSNGSLNIENYDSPVAFSSVSRYPKGIRSSNLLHRRYGWNQLNAGIHIGPWTIFHGPVIFLYVWKTIRYMNIISWDNNYLWPAFWPQNKSRAKSPVFHGPVICPIPSGLFHNWAW